ncbi:ABC transporter permease [Massilicoli timonensis]|uniref:ABC transporter permease n=1 Tax=Massilicoli timonensis TaxID=2015901 RepID=UPI000C824D36|nr:ABC transporter permease [Massilicoli timonensis]
MSLIKELYAYRELLKSNIKKEIRGKYKGSFLGVLWSFINPLLSVLVYAIVFPYLMRSTVDNYLVYLITGVIPWTFFTTVMSQGMASIKVNAGIIKKVYFPREILPLSVVSAGIINFFISCVIILVFCAIFAVGFSWHLLLLPIAALLQFLICLGLTLAFSAINIYIKDMEYIINFVINMLFYGTPILYELSGFSTQVPAFLLWLVKINPFTHLMQIYRDIFMYHQLTDIWSWAYVALIALVCLVLGLFIFKKLEKGFAEEV